MAGKPTVKRESRISVPEHAHPIARLVFALMREQGVTYDEIEWRSGILRSTLKSYRKEKVPSLQSAEALLGSFGWTLVPVPPLSALPQEALDAIEEISLDFKTDHEALAAVMARVCRIPITHVAERRPITITVKPNRVSEKVLPGQVSLMLESPE